MKPVLLLVEGPEDKHVVREILVLASAELLESVEIKEEDGLTGLLARLPAALKEEGRRTVAVVIDADDKVQEHWQAVRDRCVRTGLILPEHLNPDGMACQQDQQTSFGCWIMPNNSTSGAMERFLLDSISDEKGLVLREQSHAFVSTVAPRLFQDLDKATLAAWLAVQESPGIKTGHAIKRRLLLPDLAAVEGFVNWVKRLAAL